MKKREGGQEEGKTRKFDKRELIKAVNWLPDMRHLITYLPIPTGIPLIARGSKTEMANSSREQSI